MPATSLTLQYDALLTTTLFNYMTKARVEDQISTANAFYYMLKKNPMGYKTMGDIGERMQMGLMYELGQADAYSGYDVLDTTPADGVTSAFFDWRQASVPIAISALERKKNAGDAKLVDLLETKIMQAEIGIVEFFNKRLLVGAGGSTITTAYTSAITGASFIDPLPLSVKFDPTSSTVIGSINQATNTWWRNKFLSDGSTTYAGFLKNLRKLRNDCSKGPGGAPDLYLTDQGSYELYMAALAAAHQNPSYERADIPFENVAFFGKPVTWDEFVPDASGGSETQSTTSGTWYMLNTKFWGVRVHAETNFAPTPFVTPNDQDASTSHILWLGAVGVSNRRKQGVMGSIDTTIAS